MSADLIIGKMHERRCVYVCYKVFNNEMLDIFFFSLILCKTFMKSGAIGNHAVDDGDAFVCTAFIYSSEGFLGQQVASSYRYYYNIGSERGESGMHKVGQG